MPQSALMGSDLMRASPIPPYTFTQKSDKRKKNGSLSYFHYGTAPYFTHPPHFIQGLCVTGATYKLLMCVFVYTDLHL